MQSAGVRVKALKLELGKDLKLQAPGIWTQLWDQNHNTCNRQLTTPRTERITKAYIANCKHHQIKRFLQVYVLSHSLLWEAPFKFSWSLLQDWLLRKTHPGCLHGGDNMFLLKIPCFAPHWFWAYGLNSFWRKLRGENKGVYFAHPSQYMLRHWTDLRGANQWVTPHSPCHIQPYKATALPPLLDLDRGHVYHLLWPG